MNNVQKEHGCHDCALSNGCGVKCLHCKTKEYEMHNWEPKPELISKIIEIAKREGYSLGDEYLVARELARNVYENNDEIILGEIKKHCA